MGESESWQPGEPIVVETRRLIIATLNPEDVLDHEVGRWTGEGERSANVWKPPMPMGDYMRGLAGACDQKQRFAFRVTHRKSGLIIGYLKAQIDQADRSMVTTTIIGDERFSGGYYGSEATRGMQRYMFQHGDVRALRPRVYARNEGTIRVLKRFGYVEESRYTESGPSGSAEVCVFHISRERWLELKEEGDALISSAPDVDL